MGKGTIISGGTDGLYMVQIKYNRTRYEAQLARFAALRAAMVSAEAEEADAQKKAFITLQIMSIDKAISFLTATMPEDTVVSAWCADLAIDLSGDVGTIEVPGELTNMQIRPGYGGNAAYNAARDGQVMPTVSMNAPQAYYNLAMLPGWQKWKPLSRYATITAITGDTASVTMGVETSSQQGLVINREATLSGVPIEYMDCNGDAFEEGDEVLVLFTGQDWAAPRIVGFKDNPKPCWGYVRFKVGGLYLVWNIDLQSVVVFDTPYSNPGTIDDMIGAGFDGGQKGSSYIALSSSIPGVSGTFSVSCPAASGCGESSSDDVSGSVTALFAHPDMSLYGVGNCANSTACTFDGGGVLTSKTRKNSGALTIIQVNTPYECNGHNRASGGLHDTYSDDSELITDYELSSSLDKSYLEARSQEYFMPIGASYSNKTEIDYWYYADNESDPHIVSWLNGPDKIIKTRRAIVLRESYRSADKKIYWQVYVDSRNDKIWHAQNGVEEYISDPEASLALYSGTTTNPYTFEVRASAWRVTDKAGMADTNTTDDVNPFEDSDMLPLSAQLKSMVLTVGDDFEEGDFDAVFF